MIGTFATFFGVEQGIVLQMITVLASLATTAAILAILYLAWEPYLPRRSSEEGTTDQQPAD